MIETEIADMDAIWSESDFPDGALDPVLRSYSIADGPDDKRADITSIIQVSEFSMPGGYCIRRVPCKTTGDGEAHTVPSISRLGETPCFTGTSYGLGHSSYENRPTLVYPT